METPHNHGKWLKKRSDKQTAWKAKVAKRKKSDGGGNDSGHSGGNTNIAAAGLALSKSFKSALTTHVKLSDKEADYIMKSIKEETKGEEVKE